MIIRFPPFIFWKGRWDFYHNNTVESFSERGKKKATVESWNTDTTFSTANPVSHAENFPSRILVNVWLTHQIVKLQITPKSNTEKSQENNTHLIMKIQNRQQYHLFYIQSHHNLILSVIIQGNSFPASHCRDPISSCSAPPASSSSTSRFRPPAATRTTQLKNYRYIVHSTSQQWWMLPSSPPV